MARPTILNDTSKYRLAWKGDLPVMPTARNSTRGTIQKTFHAYVELYEQSAHDSAMSKILKGATRSPHRAQVKPKNTLDDPLDFYDDIGRVAAQVVAAEMHTKWNQNTSNNTVFVRGQATPLAVQGVRQANGYHYELTMWYDGHDIYLAFHCYAP